MSNRFKQQKNFVTFDIGLNIFFKAWLIVFLANKFFDFIDIKIFY